MRRGAVAVAAISSALAVCSSASAATPTVDEFDGGPGGIEAGSSPFGIAAGSDGNLWFTNSTSHEIGRMTTAGVVTAEFSIPTALASPRRIAGGRDGNLWFTELASDKIGQITPGGTITEHTVPTGGSQPDGIAAGRDTALWFTESGANKIGRISSPDGAITEFPIPLGGSPAPTDIAMGPDGNMWFTSPGTDRIGRIVPSGPGAGTFTQFDLPAGSDPEGITTGPGDSVLWFTEPGINKIGRITTGGIITHFDLPAGSAPRGIAVGQDGNLWFTEYDANTIGRITPTGTITHFSSGITAGAKPRVITAGPDGNLWFTEEVGNKIGRITTALDPPAFQNTAPLQIVDGEASTYPSALSVSGLSTPITDVTARLTGFSHTYPDDVEVLLVAPTGENVRLMSDNGGGGLAVDESGAAVNGLTFNFTDAAEASLGNNGPLFSGLFDPSQGTGGASFPAPAPSFPYGDELSADFDGINPNGTWKLFVNDDAGGDTGFIHGGWGLDIDVANAEDDTAVVAEDDTAQSILVEQNDDTVDGEVLNISDPANGTATLFDGDPFTAPDFVEYTPDPNYCNDPIMAPPDTFTYEITGGDTATVSVTVTCSPDPAVANDDSRTVPQDSAATDLSVLANDVDPDDEPIEIITATDPAHGTATVVQGIPDKVTYAPDAGYCNDGAAPDDTFGYTVGGGDTATVSVAVTCTPPPIPNTTITKQPKKKLKAKKKATATFEFISSLAGSTFACAIDGAAPSPCTSPKTYKLKKGKHTFSVTATAAGQKDPSPATYSFTVKKKKRKH